MSPQGKHSLRQESHLAPWESWDLAPSPKQAHEFQLPLSGERGEDLGQCYAQLVESKQAIHQLCAIALTPQSLVPVDVGITPGQQPSLQVRCQLLTQVCNYQNPPRDFKNDVYMTLPLSEDSSLRSKYSASTMPAGHSCPPHFD